MDSAETLYGSANDDEVAGTEQVAHALENLTEAALVRLNGYSRFRMRGLNPGARSGKDAEDLLRESIALTLSGRRKWKPARINLEQHLIGVMRSVSSHWAEQKEGEAVMLEENVMPSPQPLADQRMSARESIRRIESYFTGDSDVLAVIEGLGDGLTANELKEKYAMPSCRYDSALKRLRRGVRADLGELMK